jgi:hypothetical protein
MLTLDDKLVEDIPKGTPVIGITNKDSNDVKGQFLKDAKTGDSVVYIQYAVNQIQESYVECQVGANPSPNVRGCKWFLGVVDLEMSFLCC